MRSLGLNRTPKRFEICEASLSIVKEISEMSEVFDRILRTLALVGCFTIIAVVGPSASFAADAYKGKDIAERWCTGCHVVEREQQSPATDQAPPFASIATQPEFGADKLAILLLKPHPNMPKLALSRTEVANLAEYILSLK
jgi:mono/diheme cytochrome c family protein